VDAVERHAQPSAAVGKNNPTKPTGATTTAGAEALLACEGLEALLVPNDGRLDIDGDDIKLGGRDRG
jgi:hypothetical protein